MLSHVAILEMPSLPKLLCISDVAVIPAPDFKQKQTLIRFLMQTANLLGITTPKIACIAPSEQVLPSVPSSTEGAVLAKMGDRGQLGNAIVDGPLSLDVALYKEVAEHKKVKGSAVAGDPTACSSPTSIGQRLLQVGHALRRRRAGGDGHGDEGSLRAHLARRLADDQDVLHRPGLSGRTLTTARTAEPTHAFRL